MKIVKEIFLYSFLLSTITLNANEYLDLITVESSTIGVKNSKATEVSSVSYINEKQIENINPKHINELLQSIPGITSDVRTGEVVEIHMRGVGQQEFMWEDTGVAIVVDGVPLWQNGGKVRLNLSEIKSVKVIKGGASYLYGNTALAGAVIITTNKTKGEDSFLVSVESGSQKSEDYKVAFTQAFENISFSLNGNYRRTDGFWVDSNFWSKSVSSKISYYIDDTSDITLGIDKTKKYEQASRSSVTGVSEAKTTPEGNGRNSYQKDNNVKLDKYFLTYVKDFDNDSNLMVNIYNTFWYLLCYNSYILYNIVM
jgi:iron complex outermembrane receptor protein